MFYRASGIGKPGQLQKKEGYIIPQFDFDQPELFDGPPDINEVCYRYFLGEGEWNTCKFICFQAY